jgi:hypothetical protein
MLASVVGALLIVGGCKTNSSGGGAVVRLTEQLVRRFGRQWRCGRFQWRFEWRRSAGRYERWRWRGHAWCAVVFVAAWHLFRRRRRLADTGLR